jgi:hypothetical protein
MMPSKVNPLVGFLAPDDILRRAPEIGMAPVARMTNIDGPTGTTNARLRRGLPRSAAWGHARVCQTNGHGKRH